MHFPKLKLLVCSLPILLSIHQNAFAANPGKVARLSFVQGNVSIFPAGTKKWVKSTLNRPYIIGDRIWAAANTKAELQLTNGVVRIAPETSLKILNLNQQISQLQLSKGSLALQIWSLKPKQTYEVDTPNLAFVVKTPSAYRVDVDTKTATTRVSVLDGTGTVFGQKSSYRIQKGYSCTFTGMNLQNYRCTKLPKADAFGTWVISRNALLVYKTTTKYVSRETIGYQDLEGHGQWRATKQYGRVWVPRVTSNWAPYRAGQWIWLDDWGWTWVDEQPWGFAPFHYGRWVYVERAWAWIPGPVAVEPIYAPALVVFVGGRNHHLDLANHGRGIAWFPLGPGEVYIPPYHVNREYFINVNSSNTKVTNTYITNVYNNHNINIVYQNIQVPNAVTAVPTKVFVSSAPISNQVVQVPTQVIVDAPKTPVAAVVPEPVSVLGGADAVTQVTPPADAINTSAVVKTDPPPPPPPFDETQKIIEKDPGVPLSETESDKLSPGTKTEDITVVNPQPETSEAPEIKITPESGAEETTRPAEPTQPAAETTQPAAEPTQPAAEPTQPTEEPIQPTEEPTQPTEEPTQPAEEPTQPTEEPTQPTEEPTQPAEEPAQPAEEPAQPAEEPTQPAIDNSAPTDVPEQPQAEPAPAQAQPEPSMPEPVVQQPTVQEPVVEQHSAPAPEVQQAPPPEPANTPEPPTPSAAPETAPVTPPPAPAPDVSAPPPATAPAPAPGDTGGPKPEEQQGQ